MSPKRLSGSELGPTSPEVDVLPVLEALIDHPPERTSFLKPEVPLVTCVHTRYPWDHPPSQKVLTLTADEIQAAFGSESITTPLIGLKRPHPIPTIEYFKINLRPFMNKLFA